ncbi:MAG: phosphoribosylformylglycinamidine synthase, partial [Muribaculaceae bacterium]|nr:phosphoribosylformylglycinamidine synthase [Muribaculaceae bacterium]
MVVFFTKDDTTLYAVDSDHAFSPDEIERLEWLFAGARPLANDANPAGTFIGPRKEMITPWSTNAVEITQNMGLSGIRRIEEFRLRKGDEAFDPMLQRIYTDPGADVFAIDAEPAPAVEIDDITSYNAQEGLALSADEEAYLADLSKRLGRKLTDSEVFGFSQVNSEHCRHKIFNGTFIIDGEETPSTLFGLIKKTSKTNPGRLVSAYKDNVAFVKGPAIWQFAPERADEPAFFDERKIKSVLSLKAETHNFPTTVEPFNGAATGSGGEIRDRLGGGKASLPLAGTAVYMTSYPRFDRVDAPAWLSASKARNWLYHDPARILVKASNGASDFGNKFGQPLICGSLLTFEHQEKGATWGYDKVIMLAGGVGFAAERDAIKGEPEPGQAVVLAGGDNYRIGMGGGAVSSVDTGRYAGAIELNAVQRANPEMQKR